MQNHAALQTHRSDKSYALHRMQAHAKPRCARRKYIASRVLGMSLPAVERTAAHCSRPTAPPTATANANANANATTTPT